MSEDGKHHLETRLTTLDALYTKFGREGLKDQSLQEVMMLLTSKQLLLRDAPKRDVGEEQRRQNRLLEMQVMDLTGYVNAQLAAAGLGNRISEQFRGSSDYQKFLADKSRKNEEQAKWRSDRESKGPER